jgi:uncharacterized protein YjbI with pentapeptide repeats
MGARFRSILVVAIILVVVIALIIVEIRANGTGFTGKTLWDWLQLLAALAIPVLVGFGAVWYSERHNHEFEIAQLQHQNEQNAAMQRAKTEREITLDNQREVLLQTYLDKMSELLLREKLRDSAEKDEVRNIARVRTIVVLSGLDSLRKRNVLQFLYESGLIEKGDKCIVKLDIANLQRADLGGIHLEEAQLRGTKLQEADLSFAYLSEADLKDANLHGTNLRGANLSGTDLGDAYLSAADLREADLSGANLSGATVTTEQLAQAKSLKGATMPDGSIHP